MCDTAPVIDPRLSDPEFWEQAGWRYDSYTDENPAAVSCITEVEAGIWYRYIPLIPAELEKLTVALAAGLSLEVAMQVLLVEEHL